MRWLQDPLIQNHLVEQNQDSLLKTYGVEISTNQPKISGPTGSDQKGKGSRMSGPSVSNTDLDDRNQSKLQQIQSPFNPIPDLLQSSPAGGGELGGQLPHNFIPDLDQNAALESNPFVNGWQQGQVGVGEGSRYGPHLHLVLDSSGGRRGQTPVGQPVPGLVGTGQLGPSGPGGVG